MSGEALRQALDRAVRTAVASGARSRRRQRGAVQDTAVAFAEAMVMPALHSAVHAAMDVAMGQACAPWAPGEPSVAPDPGSPLWQVWAAGAMAAIECLAEVLDVPLRDPQLASDDIEQLVMLEIRMMVAEAQARRA